MDAWFEAAKGGDMPVLQQAVAGGLDPETRDKHGSTALMWAAGAGSVAAMEWLLQAGAAINTQNKDGRTSLMWAGVRPLSLPLYLTAVGSST